ncbi:SAM-dependent methyltransferase [Streptomyces zagrosensis]|uniref:S-adenosyl methyltransferase n=1 Tax=Streptomyces zagrosensis TaxID=1042984 RepID=A0A7W9V0R4_9ACTN|nr:SAM-dependent methyltransferase [Streptomyces zagrosensis]MBB5938493.1 hypothetical protein [Streptomyces zagrosensis]
MTHPTAPAGPEGSRPHPPTGVDPSVPHPARFWNYMLGGTYWYPADRQAAEAVIAQLPEVHDLAKAGREFLWRTVRWTAREAGVRQFLDIGAGLPAEPNIHQIAQRHASEARVVYVDNDPMVGMYQQAYRDSTPEGRTACFIADMRDTAEVLQRAADTLDFRQPIALVFSDCLGLIEDDAEVYAVVKRFVDHVASGSYLILSHSAPTSSAVVASGAKYNSAPGVIPFTLRGRDQIAHCFEGLELVDPGLVLMPDWHPDSDTLPARAGIGYGAVARVP